jgi:pyruvate/2-oxoglutarate dehydrogenase complex dihydrolipoamide acyltransferase (E2) component
MPNAVYVPCVNINDEIVQVIHLEVAAGDAVKAGDLVADVETDKASFPVVSEYDGYVLNVLCEVDDKVKVGSIMMWIGESPDEEAPDTPYPTTMPEMSMEAAVLPTAKARVLLEKHQLLADDIPRKGERLTAQDIETFVASRGSSLQAQPKNQVRGPQAAVENVPGVPGSLHSLDPEERGMLTTVSWHRDHAVAAYLEMEYDPRPWEDYAASFARHHKFMLSPLMPLMAYRLVEIARDTPKINATLVNGEKYQYGQVNLGFTVQAGETLYLTVIQQADALDVIKFIEAMGEVQRHAMARKLRPDESQGATLGFSSMARWKVIRHVPVLAPYTSLMVAHAAPGHDRGRAILGASYDHRVLNGSDVCRILQGMVEPPNLVG